MSKWGYLYHRYDDNAGASISISWNDWDRKLTMEYEEDCPWYSSNKSIKNYSFRKFLKLVHRYGGTRKNIQVLSESEYFSETFRFN